MRTSLFDFTLPESLIAQTPAGERDASRLLYVENDGVSDRMIRDLPELLTADDVLVFNNSKVIPARLYGKRDAVEVEILLHKMSGVMQWDVFAKPGKRLKVGQIVQFSSDFAAEVVGKTEAGTVSLAFQCPDEATFWQQLEAYGQVPLPPYIARDKEGQPEDKDRYQTVYAKHEGSVAAPTAGLHFTELLLEALKARGVGMHYVTLHVGGGTFLPVKSEDTGDHVMHSEYGILSEECADALNQAKREGKRIVAVGTTSMRILESAADEHGMIHPFHAETDIFITPGYAFRAVDRMLTNFHLPKSTLFMLVSAFSGLERMQAAYAHAIAERYRFYSYGDACLLERCP